MWWIVIMTIVLFSGARATRPYSAKKKCCVLSKGLVNCGAGIMRITSGLEQRATHNENRWKTSDVCFERSCAEVVILFCLFVVVVVAVVVLWLKEWRCSFKEHAGFMLFFRCAYCLNVKYGTTFLFFKRAVSSVIARMLESQEQLCDPLLFCIFCKSQIVHICYLILTFLPFFVPFVQLLNR